MRKFLTIAFILVTLITFGQNNQIKGDGKITGTLVDSTLNTPVEFATLSLFRLPNLTQPIDGTLTDEKGKFELKNLAPGQYAVKFSFMGYLDKVVSNLTVSDNQKNVNLGNVVFSANVKMLEEVSVTGQAALIDEKVDRLVYNAERDITSRGADAAEVLRKVPLLTVDLDGNVQLRGSSNIRVLINNKPSTIMAASVADALRQIPADQIKTVEVITSPSAKYDAEGSSGIVNIITKKNNLEGYQLSIDAGGGNRGGNLGLNGSLRMGKLGFTLGGWGRANFNPSETYFNQSSKGRTPLDTLFSTSQFGKGDDRMMFGRYTLGADYDIASNKHLSAGARFGGFSFNREQDLSTESYRNVGSSSQLVNSSKMNVLNKMPNTSMDFNLDYLHVIKPQKEFSISTLYSRSVANSKVRRTPISANEMHFENLNDSKNQEFTLQADYMTPIQKNQILETGVKGIFRSVDSDFENRFGSSSTTGDLNYNQNIGAAYLAYTYSTKSKYTFKVGGRYEYTGITASTKENGDLDISDYSNFIPNVNISKTIANKYTVKLAYNQRIQRPGMQQLNPNVNRANPQAIFRGNPELDPEVSNNVEASVSGAIKKFYLNLAVFTRFTDNAISQLTTASGDEGQLVTLTTFANVGKSQATGANFFANYQITPKWSLNGGLDAFLLSFDGLAPGLDGLSRGFKNSGWNFSGRLMSQLSLNKGWQVQAFGFGQGSRIIAQGRQSGWGHYALGFRKEFANKKGSIGLNAQNFFANKMKFVSNLETFQNSQETIDYRYNMGFNVTLNYKIGKMGPDAMKPKRKAKGVKNDDVMSTGEQQQQ